MAWNSVYDLLLAEQTGSAQYDPTGGRSGFRTLLGSNNPGDLSGVQCRSCASRDRFRSGGLVIDRIRSNGDVLARHIVEPEIRNYRTQSLSQFAVLFDAVERDEPPHAYETQLLAHDGSVAAIDSSVTAEQRTAVIDDILARLERIAARIGPIVRRPEHEFWTGTAAAFDREQGLRLIDEAFAFTGPLHAHPDCFVFEVRIDPSEIFTGPFAIALPSVSIDYTDKVVRAMTRGGGNTGH